MANVPFPLTAPQEDYDYLKSQLYELIRQVYEDKIGGADLGDVFAIVGDVFTLVLSSNSGLTKSGNVLAINPSSTGGIYILNNELLLKLIATGGLESSASGLGIKLDGASLTLSASGLKVAAAGLTPAVSVTDETTFGISKVVGTSLNYARQDHTHGTPNESLLMSTIASKIVCFEDNVVCNNDEIVYV